jgi:energy-coupling factor transporter ATP-binding protein EcfA2
MALPLPTMLETETRSFQTLTRLGRHEPDPMGEKDGLVAIGDVRDIMEESMMGDDVRDEDFSLGKLEAERERESLQRNFLPIKQYQQITDPDYIFLCGRRGSGKSAIALMLEASEPHEYKKFIPGEAENYGQFLRITAQAHKKREKGVAIDLPHAVRRLWLWVLAVQAMQIVLRRRREQNQPLDENLTIIKTYFDSLPSPLHEESDIGSLLANAFNQAMKVLKKEDEIAFETYLVNLNATQEFHAAFNALRAKMGQEKILLILDTLESYNIFKDYVLEAFEGLLDAIIAFCSDSRMENISLKLFMPAEVFDRVFGKYPGKVISRAVFMRWRSADLISMIGRRYLNVLVRTEAVPKSELERHEKAVQKAYREKDGRHLRREFWYDTGFLPQTIVNKKGDKEDCFAYMFRHTQRRPRDVIAQMQSILNVARARGEFPYISAEAVVEGVHDTRLLEHIVAEALTPYAKALEEAEEELPGYGGKLKLRLGKEARGIFYHRPAIMRGRQLKQFANQLYSSAPLVDVAPEDFLEVLINCGVIGLVEEEKRRDSNARLLYTKAKFEYIMQGNLPIDYRFLYCIHPAMAELFEMELPEEFGEIYPLPDRIEDHWLEEQAGIL